MTTYEDYRHILINKPERQWHQDPNVLHDKVYSTDSPIFSIVMPIHDQENIIERVLNNILANTVGYYEIILILDGCEDNTKNIVLAWTNQTLPSTITRIRIIENVHGIFEASCDNQGFVMSNGKYIVEIQADMQIMTFGYNIILATPLEIYDDIIAISGRCCHGINDKSHYIADGKIGDKIDNMHSMNFAYFNKVTLSHSVNRGPLVLKKSMLHELGYLDEDHYPLEASDHDLFMRAWNDRAWRCGFVPVEVYNPQSWGSTRKVRNDDKTKYLNMRESKIKYGYFGQYSTTFKYPDAEIRQMEWNDIARVRDIITKTTSPIIVQLGTNNGKDDVNRFVKSLKSPFVVLCEPFNIHNSSISDNYKGINAYIENIAIVPVKNQSAVNIYFADRDGASPEHPSYEVTSMLPSHLIKHGYSQDELKSFRVECKTLSELFDKYKLENIDYLFVDIEGCDFDVIRSINFSKYTIKNIQVEYIHLNKDELISFMTSKGYSIGDPIGNSNYDIMFTSKY